eukprot:g59652.t1
MIAKSTEAGRCSECRQNHNSKKSRRLEVTKLPRRRRTTSRVNMLSNLLRSVRVQPIQRFAPAAAARSFHLSRSLRKYERHGYEMGPVPERKGCLEGEDRLESKHKHEVHQIEFQPADPWSHEEKLEACMRAEAAMRLRDSNRLFVPFPQDLSEYLKSPDGNCAKQSS